MTRRTFRATCALLLALGLSACGPSFAGDDRASRSHGLVDTEVFIQRALDQYGVGTSTPAPITTTAGVGV